MAPPEQCGANNQALPRVGSMQRERNVGDTESCWLLGVFGARWHLYRAL